MIDRLFEEFGRMDGVVVPPAEPTRESAVSSGPVKLSGYKGSLEVVERLRVELVESRVREVVSFDFDDAEVVPSSAVDHAPKLFDFSELSPVDSAEAVTRRETAEYAEKVAQFMEDFQTGDSL